MSAQDEVQVVVVAAAQRLYGVPPEEFIAARKAEVSHAKDDGQKEAAAEIGRLRKPDVAAWALNQVVRERPDVVADLLALGARMRTAQASLDMAALQGMRVERDEAIAQFCSATATVAGERGQRLAASAQDAVRNTAIAVLADQGASDALASGLLTKALAYSGFGEVDVSEAIAVTGSGVVLAALPGGEVSTQGQESEGTEGAAEQQAAEEARRQARLEQAQAELRAAEQAEESAQEAADEAAEDLEAAEAELDAARVRYDKALKVAEKARAVNTEARAALTSAVRQRKVAAARLR
ncbi:MAG: hypothetical protein Q4G67_09325 [Actinomycetia bacterium]|nr:hypothetical protein [Actinomycetes bacterium]